MTWRNSVWYGGFRWFLVAILALFGGIGIGVFVDDSSTTSDRVVAITLLGACSVLIGIMHNWLTVSSDQIRFGYFPFYRRTLPFSDIREVSVVTIRPGAQFGGWGLKGLAKSKNGLLLGGHPDRGLRFETRDDRRYVMTFPELDPIVQALALQGCTLSAESGDDAATEV